MFDFVQSIFYVLCTSLLSGDYEEQWDLFYTWMENNSPCQCGCVEEHCSSECPYPFTF